MARLSGGSVLVVGVGGLGLEVAKNVILSGVGRVVLVDWTEASFSDLGSCFYLSSDDVERRRNRLEAMLPHLQELNQHVKVEDLLLKKRPESLEEMRSWGLETFTCILMTQGSLSLVENVNHFCHSQNIPFIYSGVFGFLGCVFCDFGNFIVNDPNGEEPKEAFIGEILQENGRVLVRTLDEQMHGFGSGDVIMLNEMQGMPHLNGSLHRIKVVSPTSFVLMGCSLEDVYRGGGTAVQVKESKTMNHRDLSSHVGTLSLMKLKDLCDKPGDEEEHNFKTLVEETLENMSEKNCNLETEFVDSIWKHRSGSFPPLLSTIGGFVSQEILKSVTGKFTPLSQWLHVNFFNSISRHSLSSPINVNTRYAGLETCVGTEVLERLGNLKLFMVGCGAIGCELLKNFALLGISGGPNGRIITTDNDLIEKSNLNRQFLFRPRHVNKSKSVVAAESVRAMNPVCKETEASVFTDDFFQCVDVVVNALDSVEARIYVDGRCVTNGKPLLESGTMGAKGHTQVVLPFLSESYSSQRDVPETETPFCTLKSFPAKSEHTIQWARNKFETLLSSKLQSYNNFWASQKTPYNLLQKINSGEKPEGFVSAVKILCTRPNSWEDCVRIARNKFEKYFNHKAAQLLYIFPADYVCPDGSLFWQMPKRPPVPQKFHIENQFLSKLLAKAYCVEYDTSCSNCDSLVETISHIPISPFVPKVKLIATEDVEGETGKEEENEEVSLFLLLKYPHRQSKVGKLTPLSFDKDDNEHIDFITATSNLRSAMYRLDPADRYQTKRIAGKIIPAIATTTACVAGLIAGELVTWVVESMKDSQMEIDKFRNSFLNLALPTLIFSQPGPAVKKHIVGDLYLSIWEKLTVQGNEAFTLQDLKQELEGKYNCELTMVALENTPIYVECLPAHRSRLKKRILELMERPKGEDYVDLVVSLEDPSAEIDMLEDSAPMVRYFF